MQVVLEGIDTAGKSTQIALLKEEFKDAIFTKEPGGTELGKRIREILLHDFKDSAICAKAELFLFLSDRAEHYEKLILPNKNKLIICDRSLISGIAYAKDFDFEFLKKLNLFALNGILPQKVVLLKLDKDTLEFRLKQKEADSIEARGVEYLLNLQERLIFTIEKLGVECEIIDASEEISVINSKIVEFIKK
ncbi:MAG: dTMP kinase [Helicobacter sp.]|nr:dTMP kinase [Helicobacteraceae bacterium]MDY3114326.1 dTMP kinase [Helicobacter sp.]